VGRSVRANCFESSRGFEKNLGEREEGQKLLERKSREGECRQEGREKTELGERQLTITGWGDDYLEQRCRRMTVPGLLEKNLSRTKKKGSVRMYPMQKVLTCAKKGGEGKRRGKSGASPLPTIEEDTTVTDRVERRGRGN